MSTLKNINRVIKLQPDYGCYATWVQEDAIFSNKSLSEFDISKELLDRIYLWENHFEATLVIDNPSGSGFKSLNEKQNFEKEGLQIWKELKKELPNYIITYFSILRNKLIE